MNSQANLMISSPVQACYRPAAASSRPALLQPVPDPGQALAAFVQASGVLARSLVAFALASLRRRAAPAGIGLQDLSGDAMQMLCATPLVLARSSRATLVCDAGTVWITQGDGGDHVLTPGQHLALAPWDQVIVQALHGPARVRALTGAP